MSDAVDRGITVTEIAPMDQPIDAAPETTAAFVGRALRGPLNTPVLTHHYGDFRRRFGDTWSRSSLGPAVQQFFEHGGKRLYIVRVANNARGAMICLPAAGSCLILRALEPGSTEHIRAAVDYDGIGHSNGNSNDDRTEQYFNLTLQRIDPDSGLIVDQEIFKRVSFVETNDLFVAEVLLSSMMVRVEKPYATHRPDATISSASRFDLSWVNPAQEGADGNELTDYDLIGSLDKGTGMFALEHCEQFDLLYLPSPGKSRNAGPAAVLAGERYSRQRGAMLVVDPAPDWRTAESAVQGVRALGYASPHILSYFPRICRRDIANEQPRVAGGALAGLLCKLDRFYGPWHELDQEALAFNREVKAAIDVDDADKRALQRAGINVVEQGPAGRARLIGSMTMGRGNESQRMFTSLPVQRLCLRIINSIDLATRWSVFEKPDLKLRARIRVQILDYLSSLADLGAFANDRFVVQCDAGLCHRDDQVEHGVTLLLVFQPLGCNAPISFTLHQTVAGCRVASTAFAPVAEDCA